MSRGIALPIALIIVGVMILGGFIVGGQKQEPRLGLSTFLSIQEGASPTSGDILTTDGTDSTWVTPSSVSGIPEEIFELTNSTTVEATSTNAGIGLKLDFFIATSTTATSTFAGGFDVDSGGLVYDLSQKATSMSDSNFIFNPTDGNTAVVISDPSGASAYASVYLTEAVEPLSSGLSYSGYGELAFDPNNTLNYASAAIIVQTDLPRVMLGSNTGAWGISMLTVDGSLTIGDISASDLNARLRAINILETQKIFDFPNFSGNFLIGTTTGLTIDYINDRLGIGTTSPYATLSVVGQVVAEYYTATSTTATSTFIGALSIGTSTPDSLTLFEVGTSSPLLFVNKNSGNVGIGTTIPIEALDVVGGNVRADKFILSRGGIGIQEPHIERTGNKAMGLFTLGIERMTISEGGNFDFKGGSLTTTANILGAKLIGTSLDINGAADISGALTGGGSGHDQFSDFVAAEHFDTSSLTAGSIPFSNGTTFLEDNFNLFVDYWETKRIRRCYRIYLYSC